MFAGDTPRAHEAQEATLLDQFGRMPLRFEANRGQAAAGVKAIARGQRNVVLLESTATTIVLRGHDRQATVRLTFEGAADQASVSFEQPLAGVANYFYGSDPSQWHENVPTFERVRVAGVYPGIDVVHYGNQRGNLEHDFMVAAGADPSQIRFAVNSECGMDIVNRDLEITTAAGKITLGRPVAYQLHGQQKIAVAAEYALGNDRQVVFKLGDYDRSLPLVIDPTLSYSTFLGGSDHDNGEAIAVDSSGNAYVVGETASLNFPTVSPAQSELANANAITDVFIAKLNSTGTALQFSTYFGGSDFDYANGIALASNGDAWITGYTLSPDFPSVGTQLKARANTSQYAYVAKIGNSGTLVFSSLIAMGVAYGITVDSDSNVYVSGMNGSDLSTTTNSFDKQKVSSLYPGGAWFAKLTSSGVISFASHVAEGQPAPVTSRTGIAVDSAGFVYVSGSAYETVGIPTLHAFVTRVDISTGTRAFITTLGGSASTTGSYLAIDSAGQAYVSGTTTSGFAATQNITGTTCASGLYVAKLNLTGSVLFSTCGVGGPLAVDSANFAYVAGKKLSPAGSTIEYDSALPFNPGTLAAETVDASGNAYVTGWTANASYTTTGGAVGTQLKSNAFDAFIAKIAAQAPAGQYAGIQLSALKLSFPTTSAGSTSTLPVTVTNTGNANLVISSLAATGDYQQPTGCVGTVLPQGMCAISVVFAPTTGGTRTGTLSIFSNASGSPHTLTLTGTGSATGPFLSSPTTLLDFGTATAFTSGNQVTVTIKNIGAQTANNVQVSISTNDFTQFNNCLTLAATNGSCLVAVTPSPQGTGQRTANLVVTSSNATNSPFLIPLSVIGIGGVGISPASIFFSDIGLSPTIPPSQNITIGNGTANSITPQLQLSDTTNFHLTSTCGTLISGQNCTAFISFTPQIQGLLSATVSITDAGSGFSQTVSISGAANQPITVIPSLVTFSDQAVNTVSPSIPVQIKNNTTQNVTIFVHIPLNSSFVANQGTCVIVAPSSTCTIQTQFVPTMTGQLNDTLTLVTSPNVPPDFPLAVNGKGIAPVITIGSSPLIPSAQIGQSSQANVMLSNVGASPVTLTSVTIAGNVPAGVFTAGTDCPTPIPAGADCIAMVTFVPAQAITYSGANLVVTFDGPGSPLSVPLSGTATSTGAFGFSRVPTPFGTQPINSTSPAQKAVLTDTSAGTVNISSIIASGDFIQSNDCPTTMNNAGTCNIWISFRPSTAGTRTGTITVNSSAGTQTLNLSGSGQSATLIYARPPRTKKPN